MQDGTVGRGGGQVLGDPSLWQDIETGECHRGIDINDIVQHKWSTIAAWTFIWAGRPSN